MDNPIARHQNMQEQTYSQWPWSLCLGLVQEHSSATLLAKGVKKVTSPQALGRNRFVIEKFYPIPLHLPSAFLAHSKIKLPNQVQTRMLHPESIPY